MPDLDLSALRKVAEAASQGPWQDESTGLGCVGGVGHTVARYVSTGDRRHIAAFDPPTVLALLDELETLRAQQQPVPLTSMSNKALRSIADDCERIITGRNEDGVFS